MPDLKKQITKLQYNYVAPMEGMREDFSIVELGKNGVVSIEEYLPQFEGDLFRYDVLKEDFTGFTVFNPYMATFNIIEDEDDDQTEETEEEEN